MFAVISSVLMVGSAGIARYSHSHRLPIGAALLTILGLR